MIKKLQKIKDRYLELTDAIMLPENMVDNRVYAKLAKEHKSLAPIAELYDKYKETVANIEDAEGMLKEETDVEMISFFEEEIETAKALIESMNEQLKILLLPKDENDDKNVIIEIRAGAGGDEASLFGGVIMRMYLKYAERMRFKVEVLNSQENELGGIKEASFLIKGTNVYSKLKFESGVHRVQRVPETESQGRVHTSTITVAVLPEVEAIDVNLNQNELRIDTYRASGAGGQHVNTTDSAVRITHLPTNIVVQCQDGRSQIKNREIAMKLLATRLEDHYQQERDSKYSADRKMQVGTGSRSERIRTYNYPQSRLTDHRINLTLYSLNQILDGDMDELIIKLEIADQKAKLEASTNI